MKLSDEKHAHHPATRASGRTYKRAARTKFTVSKALGLGLGFGLLWLCTCSHGHMFSHAHMSTCSLLTCFTCSHARKLISTEHSAQIEKAFLDPNLTEFVKNADIEFVRHPFFSQSNDCIRGFMPPPALS